MASRKTATFRVFVTPVSYENLGETVKTEFADYDAAMAFANEAENSVCAVWRGRKLIAVV